MNSKGYPSAVKKPGKNSTLPEPGKKKTTKNKPTAKKAVASKTSTSKAPAVSEHFVINF